ncbi:YfdX family protein [Thiorhodococcus fuscus]|uniref:YfdX family protein n=1 Tax=Thiorhodococcus fuscus TaxID=527200 RepID=A0ABW4Y6L3_9GAMM
MKRTYQITAATLIALAFVGVTRQHAQAESTTATSDASTITTIVTGGPSKKQAAELSEHGLAATNAIHLARLAINDGYVDSAKKLLADSRKLLDEVRKEDRPVTVTTDVKNAGKKVEQARNKERMDLIPILSELQVVEGFDTPANAATDTAKDKPQTSADAKQTATMDKAAEQQASARTQAEDKAISEAKEHLRQGDQQAAAKALKLADLTLVTRIVSLPLEETSQKLDAAIKLVDQGKLHEANLELKQIQDSMVLTTSVVSEPVAATDTAQADAHNQTARNDQPQNDQTNSAKTKVN